jgi:hypothetical protein
MRKRFRIVLAILIVAITGGVTWLALRPREPVYLGKPMSFWVNSLDAYNPYGAPSDYGIFEKNRHLLGTNAVTIVIRALEKRDPHGQAIYERVLARLPAWLGRQLPGPVYTASLRGHALDMFSMLTTDAKPAIPALIRILKEDQDELHRTKAVFCLENLGRGNKAATKALIQALNDKDWNVRLVSTNALKAIDPEAAAMAGVE